MPRKIKKKMRIENQKELGVGVERFSTCKIVLFFLKFRISYHMALLPVIFLFSIIVGINTFLLWYNGPGAEPAYKTEVEMKKITSLL